MSFEEFQNQARLYVIGALEAEETRGVRTSPEGSSGKKAKISSRNVTPCTKRSP